MQYPLDYETVSAILMGMIKQKNPHAVALGRRNRGVPKTMTDAARAQRIKASQAHQTAALARKNNTHSTQ